MKKILLIGAGKSATVLIDYLSNLVQEKNWQLTVADGNKDLLNQKVITTAAVHAVQLNIEDATNRQALIADASIVISMMPPALHYLIAKDCIAFKKHLLTASYVDEQIKKHADEIKENGLLFLYEMGLDPGIDHMSAMEIIHTIQQQNGEIISFKSHCGGLIAPESDNNPWHYKISWNPKNIILAGKAGATYKAANEVVTIAYEQLFNYNNIVTTPQGTTYSYYPNRDSLSYIPLYGLETASDFMRTTLRHPDFILGWKNIVDLRLTDEEKVYNTNEMTIAQFFKQHFKQHNFEGWVDDLMSAKLSAANTSLKDLLGLIQLNEDVMEEEKMVVDKTGTVKTINLTKAASSIAENMHQANISLQQLFYLGLEDETPINKGLCSAADILQMIAEEKLKLQKEDKDLIVMMHEFCYTLNQSTFKLTSLLEITGENDTHTAMAKTVGFPLGIAAKLILEGSIHETGLQIPTKESIYKTVLAELKKHNIIFHETLEQLA